MMAAMTVAKMAAVMTAMVMMGKGSAEVEKVVALARVVMVAAMVVAV